MPTRNAENPDLFGTLKASRKGCVLVGAEPRSGGENQYRKSETLLQIAYGHWDQLLTGNVSWRFRNDSEREV
jgi:hypothetical protein